MAFTTVKTVATGETATAADWNTYIRDNMAASIPDLFTAHSQIGVSTAADTMVAGGLPLVMGGRLSLASGTAVPMSVAGGTTLYYTPYGPAGGVVTLYDGAGWRPVWFAEDTLAASGFTTSKPHDIFIDWNGGTPTLDKVAWSSATARTTALTLQDGRYVLTGATDWNYVGTVYLDASNTFQDTLQKRLVWNYFNRVVRPFFFTENTADWTYASITPRDINANAANIVELVCGVAEEYVEAKYVVQTKIDDADAAIVTIELDDAEVSNPLGVLTANGLTNITSMAYANWFGSTGIGYHVVKPQEIVQAGTVQFDGQTSCGFQGVIYG